MIFDGMYPSSLRARLDPSQRTLPLILSLPNLSLPLSHFLSLFLSPLSVQYLYIPYLRSTACRNATSARTN